MARTTPVNAGFTIINGSGTGSNGNRIDVWAEYKLGEQSIEENCTWITAYFYAALNPAYSASTSYYQGLNSKFRVDDATGDSVSNGAYDFSSSNKVNYLGSYSGNVYHNADGSKSVSIAGSFTTVSSYISGGSVAGVVTLPAIPRASTISATAANVGEISLIAIKQNSAAFRHSVAYKFGKLTGYITAAGETSETESVFSDTNIHFRIPELFYEQMKTSPSAVCELSCTTYANGVKLGETQKGTLWVTTQESECRPDLNGTVEDVNEQTIALTGNKHTLINLKSSAYCHIQTLAKHSASVTKQLVNGVAAEKGIVTFPNVESGSFNFYVEDSRGYSNSLPITLPLIPYIKLSNNAEIARTDPTSGNAKLTLSGRCFKGSFGAVENALTIKIKVDTEAEISVDVEIGDNDEYRKIVEVGGLDYKKSHTVVVTAIDALDSVPKTLTVAKGIPVFDWGENDFRFNVPIMIEGELLCDFAVEQGSSSMGDNGVWYWTKWRSGKAECYGVRNFGDVSVSTPWGTLYESQPYEQDLPEDLFAEIPITTIDVLRAGGGTWVERGFYPEATETTTGAFSLVRPSVTKLQNVKLGFSCIGRWK